MQARSFWERRRLIFVSIDISSSNRLMTKGLPNRLREPNRRRIRPTTWDNLVTPSGGLLQLSSNDLNRARFGPYEVDLHTHELWKYGTRLKLVGQPFEILSMLIRRHGELVTRDEMRTRLW